MSLINDALKKAQKQRTGEAPPLSSLPGVGGERPANLSRGRSGVPPALFIGLGLGAVALVGLIIAAILLFRDPPPAPASVAAAPANAPAPAPAVPVETKAAPADDPDKPADNLFVVPIAAAPKTEPTGTATSAAPPVSTPASAPVTEAPAAAPARTAPAPGTMDPRAIQFIDAIKVAGIRASGADSKVLMNDRVYRIGDRVGYDFGLKLAGITASSLTFEDAQGARYTRNF